MAALADPFALGLSRGANVITTLQMRAMGVAGPRGVPLQPSAGIIDLRPPFPAFRPLADDALHGIPATLRKLQLAADGRAPMDPALVAQAAVSVDT